MSQMFVPPGYRFHPTDEELVGYYLFKKLTDRTFEGNVIPELDMLQMEPWELPGFSALNDTEWYFFSPRDKKYPKGSKSNRATPRGYWKSTGRDRPLTEELPDGCQGVKKTLVFYLGRGNLGSRTDWVMHEFRIEGREDSDCKSMDSFVLCRVYNKKGNVKNLNRSRAKRFLSSCEEEQPARASKEQKLDKEEADVLKPSIQVCRSSSITADRPFESNSLDSKNERDSKSDICFDSVSPKSSFQLDQKTSCDSVFNANSKQKVMDSDLKTGLLCTVEPSNSSDNLSADESVTSFQENEIDNQQSVSRIENKSMESKPREEVWESYLPPELRTRIHGLGVEENAKIDYLNAMICKNFNGIGYMEYLSYFSSFEEAMKKTAFKRPIARKENDFSPFLLAPLARKADSPLNFINDSLEKQESEECVISELDKLKANQRSNLIDNHLIKFEPNNGSAFVRFCSAK